MSAPDAILSLVTLGVSDLERSIAFYEALGFRRKATKAQGVGFFQAGVMHFAVWPAGELAKDSNTPASAAPAFRGVALAWNCRADAEVDATIERARRPGGSVPKPPRKTYWGSYAGYFVDPDGHLWEVAHNPHWPLTDDGRLTLPN
jgi:predicted lactoylglutathione lyase